MFGLGIHYLNGWAMAAADGAKKERAEWPPHPDRVFMALAAAWFETGKDSNEGKALTWLEQLDPPGICASPAEPRRASRANRPTLSYVPVNDTRLSLTQLPEFRLRQPRTFPVAVPHNPVVHLVWRDELPIQHREPLASLCRKVTSVGHSASLVQMWLADNPPNANLVPVQGIAQHRLRVFGRGRLDYLEGRYNREPAIAYADLDARIKTAKGKQKRNLQEKLQACFPTGRPVSLRPEPGLWQGYNSPGLEATPQLRGCLFDPRLVVLALTGKRLSLPATLKLTEALRGALLAACPEPLPEWVCGHTPHGGPSRESHIAFLPLPFVGREHADGRLMGIALALPRNLASEEAARVLEPWLRGDYGQPQPIRLFNGDWLECEAELETRESPPVSLRPETWTGPGLAWATVTPVVLDRHFNGADKWERAAETVKDACERVGLPRPLEVILHPVSLCEGVPRSNEFPWMTRKSDGGRMHHAHAMIVFREDVEGPVVVGAGRFRGYGLCRPLRQGGEDHA